jgi:hypothetical protein
LTPENPIDLARKRVRRIARKEFYQPWVHDVELYGLHYAVFNHTYSTGVVIYDTNDDFQQFEATARRLETERNVFSVLLSLADALNEEPEDLLRRMSDAVNPNATHKTGRNGNPLYKRTRTHSRPIKL